MVVRFQEPYPNYMIKFNMYLAFTVYSVVATHYTDTNVCLLQQPQEAQVWSQSQSVGLQAACLS